MQTIGIQLVWVTVADIKQAIAFYTQTLGFELREFHEEYGWAELIGKEGTRLGLAQAQSDLGYKPGSNAVPTITVVDIEEACKELKQKQVTLIDGIVEIAGHVKLQTFTDADGNIFQLCQLL